MNMHVPSRTEKFWLFVFLTVWCFFGLTGRDAWRPVEAVALAPVLDWLAHGGFAAASLSPFHTLLSGLTAWLSQPWLDVQDGARLASGGLTLAALLFTAYAALALFGPGYGAAAALALLGCFGLMLRAHALLPETALLMAYAWLIHGVVQARENARRGAVAIALAGTVATLSRGLPDLIATLLIVLLPMLSREWRNRSYRRAAYQGLAGYLLLLAIWAGTLALAGGGNLADWWHGFASHSQPERNPATMLNLLSWFAWPVWPLALWTLWDEHRRLGRATPLHPVLAALAVTFVLGMWPAQSGGGALPTLVPLSLLAAHGLGNIKRGGAQGFYWFGVLCFMFFAAAFWVYFAALEWGWPASIARHMHELSPDYRGGRTGLATIATAAALSLFWLALIPLFPRARIRPILVWATGMALTWFLLILLFRPWAESGWGYKPLIADMARHLPAGACVNADVGPAMATMLRLHLADRVRPGDGCAYWLTAGEKDGRPGKVWEGYRPRDKDKRFQLYERAVMDKSR